MKTLNRKKTILLLIAIGICFGTSVGMLNNCMGLFFHPISENLNTNISDVSLYLTILSITSALFGLRLSSLIRKFKITKIMMFGVIACSSSYFLMSFINDIRFLYVFAVINGISISSFSGIMLVTILENNFKEKLALYSSWVFCMSGIFGAIFNPVFSFIITGFGWRATFRVIALLLLLLAFPSVLIIEKTTQSFVTKADHENTKFKANPRLIPVILFTVTLIIALSISSHLSNFGISLGKSLSFSSTMVSAAMIANIVFKLLLGYMINRFGFYNGILVNLGIFFIGMIMFRYINFADYLLLIGSFLFGAVYSCMAVATPILVKEVSDEYNFTANYAFVYLLNAFSGAFFTTAISKIYDLTKSYYLILDFSMLLGIFAIIILLFIKKKSNTVDVTVSQKICDN